MTIFIGTLVQAEVEKENSKRQLASSFPLTKSVKVYEIDGTAGNDYKFVDLETGVVCYARIQTGISCLKVYDTKK